MHIIHLRENEKFNVPFSRVLEKLYLLKCLAYLPNCVFISRIKIFNKINVVGEILETLHLEDNSLNKHILFFDLLNNQRENFNLTENVIKLIKGVFFCCFLNQDKEEESKLSFDM